MSYDIIMLVDLSAFDIELLIYLQMIGICFVVWGSIVHWKITCTSPGLEDY